MKFEIKKISVTQVSSSGENDILSVAFLARTFLSSSSIAATKKIETIHKCY